MTQRALREAIEGALHALPGRLAGAEPVRAACLRALDATGAGHAAHLRDPHAWAFYVFSAEVVARLLPQGARVLDWGGLYGQVAALLRARGLDAHNYLLHAPEHYAAFEAALRTPTVHGKEPNTLALPDAWADAALSSGVLEHVREDGVGREELVLRDLARVVRPGGWLLVWSLPTLLAPADLLGKLRGAWHHEHRYTAGRVRALVRDAGWELVHLGRHGGTPLGVALKALGAPPHAALAWDWRAANAPPFAWAAQNFLVAARKP